MSIIRRRPNLTVINHFKTVMEEANSDYLVMFHDDDVMKPRFLRVLYDLLNLNFTASAVACNACYMREGVDCNDTFMRRSDGCTIIDQTYKLLNAYFLIGGQGIAPFPGYMFRLEKISAVLFAEDKGGMHSDMSFLYDIVEVGSIVWTSDVMMSYRLHDFNINKQTTISARYRLFRYLRRDIPVAISQALRDYRYTILLDWFRVRKLKFLEYGNWSWRERVVFNYLAFEIIRHLLFRPECRLLHLEVLFNRIFSFRLFQR